MNLYLLGNVTREGFTIATPLIHVTIHWLLFAAVIVFAVAAKRHAVQTRKAMRLRRLSRVGA